MVIKDILVKGLAWIDRGVVGLIVALFAALVIVGGFQVVSRYFFGLPLTWSEELQKFLHIWIVFLAIPLTYQQVETYPG